MSNAARDTPELFAAQGVRAFAYGFSAVWLGTTLEDRDLPGWQVGLVLGATIAGTALMSVLVARYADAVGRRRWYAGLYALLGGVAMMFAFVDSVWWLAFAALTGVLSTEVIESGPFTSLEQPMLATNSRNRAQVFGFGTYNAIAAIAGSLGALAAAVPSLVDADRPGRWFVVPAPVAVVGWLLARSLSPAVEMASPSQMDVPTRQAYVMSLVDPHERTPAAAYSNTARYVSRPFGPPLAALAQQVALGLPVVIAGGIKSAYDIALWHRFRQVPVPELVEQAA